MYLIVSYISYRWLNQATWTLRLYAQTSKPSPILKFLVNFILKFYGPLFLNIKSNSSITQGAVHFFDFVKRAKNLPKTKYQDMKDPKTKINAQDVLLPILKRNCYMATFEMIGLAMVFHENEEIREEGVNAIFQIRQANAKKKSKLPRKLVWPRAVLNLHKAKNFTELLNFKDLFKKHKQYVTEPPLLIQVSHESLLKQVETGDELSELVENIPCHSTLVELGVKHTSEACAKFISHEKQQSAIIITEERRQQFGANSTKGDFFKKN